MEEESGSTVGQGPLRVLLWKGVGGGGVLQFRSSCSLQVFRGKVRRSEYAVGAVLRASAGRRAADGVEDSQRVGKRVPVAVLHRVDLETTQNKCQI